MGNELLLKDVDMDRILDPEIIKLKDDRWRIYYSPITVDFDNKLDHGFEAIVLMISSCYGPDDMTDNECVWNENYTTVTEFCRVTAYFDGIRHLYFFPAPDVDHDRRGYDYYPEMDTYLEIFSKLKELESIYCRKD